MFYREFAPAPHLARYVRCFWVLRAARNPFVAPECLIPDGTTELIFNLGAPYRRCKVDGADGADGELVKGSHVVGTRAHGFLIEQMGVIDHMAIRFNPGGLRAVVPFPAHEITDLTVEADRVFGGEASELKHACSMRKRIRFVLPCWSAFCLAACATPVTRAESLPR